MQTYTRREVRRCVILKGSRNTNQSRFWSFHFLGYQFTPAVPRPRARQSCRRQCSNFHGTTNSRIGIRRRLFRHMDQLRIPRVRHACKKAARSSRGTNIAGLCKRALKTPITITHSELKRLPLYYKGNLQDTHAQKKATTEAARGFGIEWSATVCRGTGRLPVHRKRLALGRNGSAIVPSAFRYASRPSDRDFRSREHSKVARSKSNDGWEVSYLG